MAVPPTLQNRIRQKDSDSGINAYTQLSSETREIGFYFQEQVLLL